MAPFGSESDTRPTCSNESLEAASCSFPLVVDLDGTLIKTDLLFESILHLLHCNPIYLLVLPFWLARGKSALKAEVARRVRIEPAVLPYNKSFLEFLRQECARGRLLVLATASHVSHAKSVADYLGIFTEVMATDGTHNLAGQLKGEALVKRFGRFGFDYAGNAKPDLAIWPDARRAILVNPESGVASRAHALTEVEAVFSDRKSGPAIVARAVRVHQWSKNLLLFLPLFAAHAWNSPQALSRAFLAFGAFCCVASAIYLFNDMLDLHSDRAHSRKCKRPLAAGDLPLAHGVALMLALLSLGIAAGNAVSPHFLMTLLGYLLLTTAYSLYLKTYVLVDVLLLAGLYTLRVIAGAVAIEVVLSFWLLAFSMFLFVSLALLKRCTELQSLRSESVDAANGRDYRVADLPTLTSLGTAAIFGANLILALYIDSPDVTAHYSDPRILWLLCPLHMFWSGRMWIKCGRREMHDDPIVFSAKDRASWAVALACIILVVLAI